MRFGSQTEDWVSVSGAVAQLWRAGLALALVSWLGFGAGGFCFLIDTNTVILRFATTTPFDDSAAVWQHGAPSLKTVRQFCGPGLHV